MAFQRRARGEEAFVMPLRCSSENERLLFSSFAMVFWVLPSLLFSTHECRDFGAGWEGFFLDEDVVLFLRHLITRPDQLTRRVRARSLFAFSSMLALPSLAMANDPEKSEWPAECQEMRHRLAFPLRCRDNTMALIRSFFSFRIP